MGVEKGTVFERVGEAKPGVGRYFSAVLVLDEKKRDVGGAGRNGL